MYRIYFINIQIFLVSTGYYFLKFVASYVLFSLFPHVYHAMLICNLIVTNYIWLAAACLYFKY